MISFNDLREKQHNNVPTNISGEHFALTLVLATGHPVSKDSHRKTRKDEVHSSKDKKMSLMDALQSNSPLQKFPTKEALALSQTAWLDCTVSSTIPAPGYFHSLS